MEQTAIVEEDEVAFVPVLRVDELRVRRGLFFVSSILQWMIRRNTETSEARCGVRQNRD